MSGITSTVLFARPSGLMSDTDNPFVCAPDALAAGADMDIRPHGLRTRNGSSVVSAGSLPVGAVKCLKQVRFPTNESSYLVAQVEEPADDFTWSSPDPGAPKREGATAVWDSHKRRILVFGGTNLDIPGPYTDELIAYYPETRTWTTLAPFGVCPDGRANHSAIYDPIGSRMVMFGGQRNEGDPPLTDELWVFDCAIDEWSLGETHGPGPGPIHRHAAVYADGRMIVHGGETAAGEAPGGDMYALDLSSFEWTVVSGEGPVPRVEHIAEFDPATGKLFIIGGAALFGGTHKDVWSWDGSSWSQLPDMPFGIQYAGSASYQGKVFVYGGGDTTTGEFNEHIRVFRCADGQWILGDRPPEIPPALLHGMIVLDDSGAVYLLGGASWPPPVRHLELFVCPDYGGITGRTRSRSGLYAAETPAAGGAANFVKIFDLGPDAGECSIAVLNDRCVITEGVNHPPLVWGGCLSEDAEDWMSPKAVLVTLSGEMFYDVSAEVLDSNKNTSAHIGGIQSSGYLAVCCDIPAVEAFYLEPGTPNVGQNSESQAISVSVPMDASEKYERENYGTAVDYWARDSGVNGHFEGRARIISGAAIDLGHGTPLESAAYAGMSGQADVAGWSYRLVLAAADLVQSGDEVRLTLSAGAAKPMRLGHVSIGERDVNASVKGPFDGPTFKEVKFQGESGCLVQPGQTATSDWVPLSVDESKDYLVIFDVASDTTADVVCFTGSYGYRYFKSATASWNAADPSGFVGSQLHLILTKVEVRRRLGVKIPCVSHTFAQGDSIEIRGAVAYDGTHEPADQSNGDANHFVVSRPYIAETFPTGACARKRIRLGPGGDAPDVAVGLVAEINGIAHPIVGITGAGSHAGEVTLGDEAPPAAVAGIYGLTQSPDGVTVCQAENHGFTTVYDSFAPEGGKENVTRFMYFDRASVRQVIRSEELSGGGPYVKLTFYASDASSDYSGGVATPLSNNGAFIQGVSIVERQGESAAGVTAPTRLFFGGKESVWIPKGGSAPTSLIPFTLDPAKDYLVIVDMRGLSVHRNWQAGQAVHSMNEMFLKSHWGAGSGCYLNRRKTTEPYPDGPCETSGLRDVSPIHDFTAPGTEGSTIALKLETSGHAITPEGIHAGCFRDTSGVSLTFADSFKGLRVAEVKPQDTEIMYAVSFTNLKTFAVYRDGAWRRIIREAGVGREYNASTTDSPEWVPVVGSGLAAACRRAFSNPLNRMSKEDLEALTPEQWSEPGGMLPGASPAIHVAFGLKAAGGLRPILKSVEALYRDKGTTVVEGLTAEGWSAGDGWDDGTDIDGVSLAKAGAVKYRGDSPFEAEYGVVSGVPGYWYRVRTNGASPGTSLTRVMYKAPCRPLSNIGDGRPEVPNGFVRETSSGHVQDLTALVADKVDAALSSADTALTPGERLYIGAAHRFHAVEFAPARPNSATAAFSAEYWNGAQWRPLAVEDGTSHAGKTLVRLGKITFQPPSDWNTCIPFDAFLSRGWWIRLASDAALSEGTSVSECRLYTSPSPIVRSKFASVLGNRLVLAAGPDAADRIHISRPLEEYGFCGDECASYRVGGQDSIICTVNAWNSVLVGKVESWHQVRESDAGFVLEQIEAARYVPVNSRVVVKAPLGFKDGARYGLFFLNRYGAFVSTGLHVDSLWNTARGGSLSDQVDWWRSGGRPRLDLDLLHLACGEYQPELNRIVWAVPMIDDDDPAPARNNRLIVYDLTLRAWTPPFRIAAASLCLGYARNPRAPGKIGEAALYAGDYEGRVLRILRPADTQDPSGPVHAWVDSGRLDFGRPESRKLLRRVGVMGRSERPVTLTVWTDGRIDPSARIEIPRLDGAPEREFESAYEMKNVQGRFFKFRVELSGPAEIYGLQLAFTSMREWDDG